MDFLAICLQSVFTTLIDYLMYIPLWVAIIFTIVPAVIMCFPIFMKNTFDLQGQEGDPDVPTDYRTLDIASMTGKLVLVTGGSRGIGKATVAQLYKVGATVIVAGRQAVDPVLFKQEIDASLDKEDAAATQQPALFTRLLSYLFSSSSQALYRCTTKATERGELHFMTLDLSNYSRTVAFCTQLCQQFKDRPLDAIVCNAGQFKMSGNYDNFGISDLQSANYVGHYILVMNLLEKLVKSSDSRLIFLSSVLYDKCDDQRLNIFSVNENNVVKRYSSSMMEYAKSKCCCVTFALFLSRVLKESHPNLRINISNPGTVRTDIFLDNCFDGRFSKSAVAKFLVSLTQTFALTIEQGAQNSVYLAASDDVREDDIRGCYYDPKLSLRKTVFSKCQDAQYQQQLFQATHDYVIARLHGEEYFSFPELKQYLNRTVE